VNTWCKLLLRNGSLIQGKWHGQSYRVIRSIGEGMNGAVYQVEQTATCRAGSQQRQPVYALKIGFDPLIIQSEINMMRKLGLDHQRQYLIDADDAEMAGQTFSFCVVLYVEGLRFQDFLRSKGYEWLPVIGTSLLQKMVYIHRRGYVFGDLKSEHSLIGSYGQVRLIDYGGVTPIGHSIRQFTPHYDRGYWNAGSRRADEAYDLFSFAILCLESVSPDQFSKACRMPSTQRHLSTLVNIAEQEPRLQPFVPFLRQAWKGTFLNSQQAYEHWLTITRHPLQPNISRRMGLLLKIVFTCSILVFICTLVIVMP
jgi:serine/threonine-protein kinase